MLDRTTPPPVHTMGTLTLPIPEIEKLQNGLTVYSVNGGSQDVCQLSIVWQGGTCESHNPWVPRIMASVMREGTSSMSGSQISEALDFNGAVLRIAAEAHYTALNLTVLNSKIEAVLPLVREIICDATMPESAFATYRDIELRGYLLSQSKVIVLCQDALAPLVKGRNHPTAQPTKAEDISGITLEEVRDCYRRVITADQCKAFVSGRIEGEVYGLIRQMLASLPAPHEGMPLRIDPYEPEAPDYVELTKEGAMQAAVCMALPAPARTHPDYVPLRMTVNALGGYFGSRLMKNIREDKGYTYGIGAYLLGSPEGSYIAITAQTDAKYVDLLIEEVRGELRRMASDPVEGDELLRLRQNIASSLMEYLDSPFSIMDYYRTIVCVGLPKGYFEQQVECAQRLDSATISLMAERYLRAEALRIAVVK